MWRPKVSALIGSSRVRTGAVAVVSFSAGALAASVVSKKVLQKRFDEEMTRTLQEAHEQYKRTYKVGEFSDPTEAFSEYSEEAEEALVALRAETTQALESYRPSEEIPEDPVLTVVEAVKEPKTHNVFADHVNREVDDHFTQEELDARDDRYVISHDEYMSNEFDSDQIALTYFSEDDVLVDPNDMPIPDKDGVVGVQNLSRFGKGSKDRNVVYVRNHDLGCEYEITLTQGSYHQMMGLDEPDSHLEHSEPRRKFKLYTDS